jgi:uncharacterized C2H2 Zn-finger protein
MPSNSRFSSRDITKAAVLYHQLTGESPMIKNARHLPFSKYSVVKNFGTWNKMLEVAGLPLNMNKPKELKCPKCKIVFIRQQAQIKKAKKQFCSSACSASFYTIGRKHSEETKKKISESLKAHRMFIKKSLPTVPTKE